MKKFNWIVVLLVGYVTCGIYALYAWFKIAKDHNKLAEKYEVKKIMGFIPALLLGIITCGIFMIVWMYQYMKQMVEIDAAKGVTPVMSNEPILLLLLSIVPILSYYVIFENHNATVDGEDAIA